MEGKEAMTALEGVPDARPWRRRPDDGDAAWAAFVQYTRLARRSVRKAADAAGVSRSKALQWSSEYDWVSRAAAFDAYRERIDTREVEASKRRQVLKDMKATERALDLVNANLDRLLERFAKSKKYFIAPQAMTAMLTAAANLSRVARGEATAIERHEVADEARRRIGEMLERYARSGGASRLPSCPSPTPAR